MRVAVGLSGGVDSSVAALLLKEAGHEVTGITMRLWREGRYKGGGEDACFGPHEAEDIARAEEMSRVIGIPYRVFDCAEDYEREIIGYFREASLVGLTPNPCVMCNAAMKFGMLPRVARQAGLAFDRFATGHYARIEEENGRFYLKKGLDEGKDQSYVLYHLTPAQLSRVLFPLGDLSKSEVRRIAEEQGFLNAKKPDSQDICFVPDGDYARVVQKVLGKESAPGPFLSPDGRVLGEHKGIIHYTVGQRKGLGIASSAPLYVTDVRSDLNAVILSHGEGLFTRTFEAQDLNLNGGEDFSSPRRVKVKIRYRAPEQPATVERTGEDTLRVTFEEPQRAVTRGQSAVVYDGDTVLGGGEICKIIK